jgi:hypothetical protein
VRSSLSLRRRDPLTIEYLTLVDVSRAPHLGQGTLWQGFEFHCGENATNQADLEPEV